ncbi:protein of unknown function [Methanocaldococcus lauensis]|nr:protein of unknown function [Methanocaldococcus lauensis]
MKFYNILIGCIIAGIYGILLYYILSNISTLSQGWIGAIIGITAGLFTYMVFNIFNRAKNTKIDEHKHN